MRLIEETLTNGRLRVHVNDRSTKPKPMNNGLPHSDIHSCSSFVLTCIPKIFQTQNPENSDMLMICPNQYNLKPNDHNTLTLKTWLL